MEGRGGEGDDCGVVKGWGILLLSEGAEVRRNEEERDGGALRRR